MRFLITGITGFVGPHLAHLLLKEGHTVWGLIRASNGREKDLLDVLSLENLSKINWVYGDLTDYSSLNQIFTRFSFDGIFHLAAQSHVPKSFEQPVLTFHENVMGTVNLLSCIERNQKDCRVHVCSSSEVYGDTCKDIGLLKEGSPLLPINPYATSKTAIDLHTQERINNGFIDGFVTRAFSHTGPRRGFNFSISSDAYQIAKMMIGKQERVLLIGNLKTERVVIDVRDCVRAYYLLMINKGLNGVYNVCGIESHRMQYFTDLLIKQSHLKDIKQQIYKPFYRDIDIQVQIGDTKRLRDSTNWHPTISIEDTMKDLLYYWVRKLT